MATPKLFETEEGVLPFLLESEGNLQHTLCEYSLVASGKMFSLRRKRVNKRVGVFRCHGLKSGSWVNRLSPSHVQYILPRIPFFSSIIFRYERTPVRIFYYHGGLGSSWSA